MAGMKFNADIDLKNIVKLRQEIDKLKKSLIEIASVPNSDAAIKQLESEIDRATKKLSEYKDSYAKLQKIKYDIDSSNSTVKRVKEETSALQSTNKWIIANTESVKEADRQIKQLKKDFSALSDEEKVGDTGTAKIRQIQQLAAQRLVEEEAVRKTIKAQKDQIIQSNAEEGSITALRKQLILLIKDYDDLGRVRRGGDAGKALLTQISNVQKELNAAEQASGRFQRNVGNYASGWNGLSMSIQQIGRELPSLAVGWSTFFLAISNNLPILADEIKRARIQFEDLKKSGQAATPVWKQVVSSIVSWQTALTVGITLLTLYGDKVVKWIGGLSKTKEALLTQSKALENVNEALIKNNGEYGKSVTKVKMLSKEWRNLSSKKEQIQWIKDNKGEFDKLDISINNVSDAENAFVKNTNSVITALKLRAQAAAAQSLAEKKYEEALIKRSEAELKREKASKIEKAGGSTTSFSSSVTGAVSYQSGSAELALRQQADDLDKQAEAVEKNAEAYFNLAASKELDAKATLENAKIQESHRDIKDNYNSISDQQKKIADLLDKQALERKRKEEDFEYHAAQAKIDAMAEGEAKIRAQRDLDNKKEIQDLERQREDYIRTEIEYQRKLFDAREELNVKKNKNYKKKTFDPSSVKVDTSSIDATIGYVSKRQINDQIRNQEEAWNEYIIKYGTFQQKKEAITREYEEKIKKAQNQWEAKSLQKELEETISSINLSELKQNFNWDAIFGNLSLYSSKKLKELRTQLKDLLENDKSLSVSDKTALIEQYNRLGDAIIKDQNALGKLFGYKTEQQNQVQLLKEEYELRKNIYDKLVEEQQIIQKRYSDSKTNLESFLKGKGFGADTSTMDVDKILSMFSSSDVEGMENFQSLFSAFSKSGKELSNITSQVDKAGKSMDGASEAFQGAGSNMASTVSMIDTIVHGINDNVQSANELIKILELEDTKFGEGFDSFAKSSQYATQAWESLKSGNIMGVAAGVAGSIKELGNAIGSWFGLNANYSDYNEMVAKYDVLLDVWDQLLDKKKAYINESYGAEATKAGKEALDLLKAERDITRELASSRLDAGAGVGSHSMAYRMWQGSYKYEGQNWKDVAGEISSALGGVEFNSMWNLLYMSADQLEWIKTNYSGLWSQMDTDFRGYLDDIIQYGETEAEIIESVKEQITGISFDSFRDSYVSLLSDLDSTNKDFADSFEEYLRKSILQSVIAKNYDTKIQELYDSWSKAGEDGLFSESEVDRLRSMQQSITDAMLAERDRLEEVFGWSSSSSQEASKKGFATASQDSIDELNGRFTALQIAGEEIKNQNQLQTMSILELRADMLPIIANTTGIKDIASETRDLLRLSYEELTGIHDDTTSMNKSLKNIETDIAEVKRNTNGLSKR
ncbi:hypothetical protein [Bacteroides ovatus]|uniref:hypothetical protein n=1 Tax=Bacteroides ovatus TaxID=28116 RepID=UPI00321B878B